MAYPEKGRITDQISIHEYDSYTLLSSTSGDTMEIQDAKGLEVYDSIVDEYIGQIVVKTSMLLTFCLATAATMIYMAMAAMMG